MSLQDHSGGGTGERGVNQASAALAELLSLILGAGRPFGPPVGPVTEEWAIWDLNRRLEEDPAGLAEEVWNSKPAGEDIPDRDTMLCVVMRAVQAGNLSPLESAALEQSFNDAVRRSGEFRRDLWLKALVGAGVLSVEGAKSLSRESKPEAARYKRVAEVEPELERMAQLYGTLHAQSYPLPGFLSDLQIEELKNASRRRHELEVYATQGIIPGWAEAAGDSPEARRRAYLESAIEEILAAGQPTSSQFYDLGQLFHEIAPHWHAEGCDQKDGEECCDGQTEVVGDECCPGDKAITWDDYSFTEPPLAEDAEYSPITLEAHAMVFGDRQKAYGHPLDDFSRTADFWTAWLGDRLRLSITAEDVGPMMCLLKLSRQRNAAKRDNMVDCAGYAETTQRVIDERERRFRVHQRSIDEAYEAADTPYTYEVKYGVLILRQKGEVVTCFELDGAE